MRTDVPVTSFITSEINLLVYWRTSVELIGKIFSFLTISSIFIGGTGFFLVYLGFLFLGMNPCILTCFSVALMTFGTYCLDKLKGSDEDLLNMPERQSFFSGRKKLAKICSVAAVVLAIMLTIFSRPSSLPIVLSPVLANIVYASRLLPGVPRLKDIPVIKNVVVASIWATGGTLLPAMSMKHEQSLMIAAVFYFMIAKCFINTVLYDVRDLKGDRENNVRTLPVILGERKTIGVLLLMNSTLLPLLKFAETNIRPLAAVMVLYGYAYILYFRKRRNPLALEFFVDGEWMLAFILLSALKGLGLWV
jgi:4-hydroxybenzoate polyprenyltransferase